MYDLVDGVGNGALFPSSVLRASDTRFIDAIVVEISADLFGNGGVRLRCHNRLSIIIARISFFGDMGYFWR